MVCLKELSTGNLFASATAITVGNILTSTKFKTERNSMSVGMSTTGLTKCKKIVTELLKEEQALFVKGEKQKTFNLTQILILLELATKSAKEVKSVNLKDLILDFGLDGVEIPDFKMSRNANNLSGGRDIEVPTDGWGFCTMATSKENKRWQTITLNAKGLRLMKKLSEL